jgi:hypothetical protein
MLECSSCKHFDRWISSKVIGNCGNKFSKESAKIKLSTDGCDLHKAKINGEKKDDG